MLNSGEGEIVTFLGRLIQSVLYEGWSIETEDCLCSCMVDNVDGSQFSADGPRPLLDCFNTFLEGVSAVRYLVEPRQELTPFRFDRRESFTDLGRVSFERHRHIADIDGVQESREQAGAHDHNPVVAPNVLYEARGTRNLSK
jgi:hypothetical protein